jgi:hypothetical protein
MRREERVFKVPPVAISIETADSILRELRQLTEERRNSEFEQRLRIAYNDNPAGRAALDPGAANEQDFVNRNRENPQFRAAANIPTYQNHVFLATSGNVSFDAADFELTDVPKDVYFVKARADGLNGRFIELQLKTDFNDFNEARNWKMNQFLVQGEDRNWVNAVYERLRLLLIPEQLKVRKFVYGNVLKVFWSSIVLVLFAEYRIARWLRSGFNLREPLSGTGALVMFGVLLCTLIAFGNLAIPLYTYWFPYFEVDGNLSRARTASRTVVVAVVSAIYTAAILNVLALVFGPALNNWFAQN